ncbi:hypothetical protein [Corynebacterium falsenii]|nr:hypothetical protein [Corynebacterium falsenii]
MATAAREPPQLSDRDASWFQTRGRTEEVAQWYEQRAQVVPTL